MSALPDPIWPVVLLAFIQAGDAIMCIKPVPFIVRCLEGVNWPRRHWWILPPLKFAAAAGLVLGIWLPYLGAVTCGALVLYFVVAIAFHIAARDFGRNLFLNAAGMLLICVATGVYGFLT
ncbi:DoxX family protein [Streptosporangium sandarakinum]|uniref:DoxX family protein n=1 Tax=Streptosporangium sandarakinum TaxID=1260955 RepID=UPI0034342A47